MADGRYRNNRKRAEIIGSMTAAAGETIKVNTLTLKVPTASYFLTGENE
ncbi:MAG: hypothetical protein V4587_09625 [Acidobacteriota bacterium]